MFTSSLTSAEHECLLRRARRSCHIYGEAAQGRTLEVPTSTSATVERSQKWGSAGMDLACQCFSSATVDRTVDRLTGLLSNAVEPLSGVVRPFELIRRSKSHPQRHGKKDTYHIFALFKSHSSKKISRRQTDSKGFQLIFIDPVQLYIFCQLVRS